MGSPYKTAAYARARKMQLGEGVLCVHCRRARATELDHDPPLGQHKHRDGSNCCRLIPSCSSCARRQGGLIASGRWRPASQLAGIDEERERDGLAADDPRWAVPWLEPFLAVPDDATWPRLMSLPHRRAVGTLGPEFIDWAAERTGRPLRWWQRLVATRLLEVDRQGRLVWETVVFSTARQVGKSWLLRELCLWRIHQGERFGEPQDVLHTGKDLAVTKEVQRPARIWAKQQGAYKVREVNGQEEIELIADGSRWMLRAKDAVYGYAVSMAAVDEAWKVRASSVDEGLTPTMVEREQAQLVLLSTAHRNATKLMLERRMVALAELESGDGDLLIEWSAPEGADLNDPDTWRAASPHWSARRADLIGRQLAAMHAGELHDPEEPDAVESFKAQWTNRWPKKLREPDGPTEPLLPEGRWEELAQEDLAGSGPIYVALEDDYGFGAAHVAAQRLPDGRIEVDGRLWQDWDSAIAYVERFDRPIRRLQVGASLLDRLPAGLRAGALPCTGTQTRIGLALLRDLALGGGIVHDVTTHELDETLALAMVRESPTGLHLLAKGPTHLVRALVWALVAAHRPAPAPAIH